MKPILAQHNLPRDGNDIAARRVRSVTINLAESPLGWLRVHGKITDRQFAAGELLRRDYERAALAQRTTMRWDAVPKSNVPHAGSAHGAATNTQIDAKARFDAALAVAGSGLADILWRVVCAGESVPTAEKGLGWPARAGRLVLTLALDRVADYYRLG
jgi:Domain of unknown function (DUF6456)